MDGLAVWTIYDHPLDFPDSYVARQWLVGETGLQATANVVQSQDLEVLRTMMLVDLGLTCLPRSPEDDPKVVESWV